MKNLLLIIFLCFTGTAFAQTDSSVSWSRMSDNKNANFYQVQQDFYNSWQGRTIERGKGYKPFKRWEAYMAPRVFPSGDLSLPSATYTNYDQWKTSNSNFSNLISAANWTELGPVGSPTGPSPYSRTGAGRVNFVRFDPTNVNTMYVGAPDGGLWKSTNGGTSWTTNTDFLTIIGCSDLAIDPTNTQIMYLATGDLEGNKNSIGVLKSTDGGTTWNTTGASWPISNYWKISKMLMNPANPLNMLIATNVGVFRTTDGWVTSSFRQGGNFKDMEFKPGDANTVYTAGTTFWKSTDNGVNWSQVTSGLPSTNVSRIALGVSAGNAAYVYALIGKAGDIVGDKYSFLGMYRSVDDGANFSLRSSTPNLLGYATNGLDLGGQAFYDLAIAVSPTNAENVTTGGVNHWKSTNGGTTWTNLSFWASGEVHADVHELNYLPGSSTTLFSCNDGGIFKSTDDGDNFVDISHNLAIAQVVGIGLSANVATTIVNGEQDNGTNLKTGSSWANISGGDGGECIIDYTNNNTIYIQYVEGAFSRSDNAGATSTSITSGLPTGFDFYSTWVMDPVNPNRLYVGGIPTLYTTADKGANWTALGTPAGTGTIKGIAVAPSNTTIIYTVKDDAVSKSTNSGGAFSNITGTLPVGSAALTSIKVSNTNPDKIWVTFSGYSDGNKVFKSTDGGTTWTNISTGLPNLPINIIVSVNGSADDAVYAGADMGVYYLDNLAAGWVAYNTNLPNTAVRDLEIYYPTNKLRAGTYGRGVWESDLNSAVVTWTGATNTSWTEPTNWSNSLVPGNTTTFIIPNVANQPVLSGDVTAENFTINSGAAITIGSHTLTVTGTISGTGTFTGSSTSNLTINGAAGSLNFTAGGRAINNLTIGVTGAATLGTALDIYGVVGFTAGGSLNMNAQAVNLKSTNTATARIADLTGSTLTGATNVTVERFINDAGHRAWRLLSAQSVTGTETIRNAWQEGGAIVANKGTWITSGASLLPGFDASSVNGASILAHNQVGPSWTTIPVANTDATALSSQQGYMLFVRGDRNYTATLPSPTAYNTTVLKTTGTLKQGSVGPVTVSATGSGRTLVGNPYASPIDIDPVFLANATLDQAMYVWDPSLTGNSGVGGFRFVERNSGNYRQTPVVLGGGPVLDANSRYIHSGQAFFLKASVTDASVSFIETMKSGSLSIVNPIVSSPGEQQIFANLMIVNAGNVESLADGIRVGFDATYSSTTSDDFEKMGNFAENISSYRDGKKLIVEKRPMIVSADTIFLKMTNTGIKDYRFKIGTIDFVQTGATAYLQDKYLNKLTSLDLAGSVTDIDFSVTADAASAAEDRFSIVFALKGTLPVSFTNVKAVHQGYKIAVEWKVSNQLNIQQYEVEKSTDGINFTRVETQTATGINGSDAAYSWLDLNPVTGKNTYRIRAVALGGDSRLSQIVTVNIVKGKPVITVYPNPVINHQVGLQFSDMDKGIYQLRLFNNLGQQVFAKTVNHAGGTTLQTISLGTAVASGNYRMDISKPDGSKTTVNLVIAE